MPVLLLRLLSGVLRGLIAGGITCPHKIAKGKEFVLLCTIMTETCNSNIIIPYREGSWTLGSSISLVMQEGRRGTRVGDRMGDEKGMKRMRRKD